jgi:hypothetical protein
MAVVSEKHISGKWQWSPAELMTLADRMIARGTSKMMPDSGNLLADCMACGRILAHLLITEKITATVVLGKPETKAGNGQG